MNKTFKNLIAVLAAGGVLAGGGGAIAYATTKVTGKTSNAAAAQYPEKPGCGDEKNIGISGNSGAHGGQPPKSEERGDCPHSPGVDGN